MPNIYNTVHISYLFRTYFDIVQIDNIIKPEVLKTNINESMNDVL